MKHSERKQKKKTNDKIQIARYLHVYMQNNWETTWAVVRTNNGTKEIRK